MGVCLHCGTVHNVGFVGTRLAGTDGVSLETEKWAHVFQAAGFNSYYFAGELDRPEDHSFVFPEAHFRHPEIMDIYRHCFGVQKRSIATTEKIHRYTLKLKEQLYRFIEKFDIQVLVPENALTIPLNLPLGIALTELISETGMPTIAHHHDFFWERQRFLTNAAWEYLHMAFPPQLPSIRHVVINTLADNQLGLRTGISATVVPNVMDFDHPPDPPDAYARDVRQSLGIDDDQLLVLQPTRVVKRKGIEHAIELVRRLGRRAVLVISHASGDEGYDYEQRLRTYSRLMGVDTRFVEQVINEKRGRTGDGRKIYTLEDIYPHADLVTYPSTYEGFGNAFLEAVYFRKPIVVNAYAIYQMDIKPKGFEVIELDGYVDDDALRKTRQLLDDPRMRREMVDRNFEIGRRCYSYKTLERTLGGLIATSLACYD